MGSSFPRRTAVSMGFGALTALSAATIFTSARKLVRQEEAIAEISLASGTQAHDEARNVVASIPTTPTGLAIPLVDIPVGGGTVLIEHRVVATQPEQDEFYVLHTKCPHDNCDIGDIRDGEIICFCHGSRFSMTGALERGPARKGLAKREMEIVAGTMYETD